MTPILNDGSENDMPKLLDTSEYLTTQGEEARIASTSRFVHNMGVLAGQTSEHIERMNYIAQDNTVRISYRSGHTVDVNVAGDSWMQMVKDVFGRIEL